MTQAFRSEIQKFQRIYFTTPFDSNLRAMKSRTISKNKHRADMMTLQETFKTSHPYNGELVLRLERLIERYGGNEALEKAAQATSGHLYAKTLKSFYEGAKLMRDAGIAEQQKLQRPRI